MQTQQHLYSMMLLTLVVELTFAPLSSNSLQTSVWLLSDAT